MSKEKKLESSIHLQQCVINALESDIRNPARLNAEIVRLREQAKTLSDKADTFEERLKNLHEMHTQAKNQLKSLKIQQRSSEIAEFVRLQNQAEELRKELEGE